MKLVCGPGRTGELNPVEVFFSDCTDVQAVSLRNLVYSQVFDIDESSVRSFSEKSLVIAKLAHLF